MVSGCYPRPSIEERFVAGHDRRRPHECWPWLKGTDPKGYGVFSINNKDYKAHRIAWQFAHGAIPDGMHVLHTCDNPSCVNPKHLFIGSNNDNVADMVAKGRQSKGEHHYASKLTNNDIIMIRSSHDTQIMLAAKYGVSQSTISDIRNCKKWKHL